MKLESQLLAKEHFTLSAPSKNIKVKLTGTPSQLHIDGDILGNYDFSVDSKKSGKNGKNGHEGKNGINGQSGRPGRAGHLGAHGINGPGQNGGAGEDGGAGQDGTDAEDGTDGEDGQNSGRIIVEVYDPSLLLFCDFEAFGGKKGLGGKGGKGGKGGAGGFGGQGGAGGMGSSYTTRNGDRTVTHRHASGHNGRNGANGPPGRDGRDGRDGKDGSDGQDGDIQFVLLNKDNTVAMTCKNHPSLQISSYDIFELDQDGIFEPGDDIVLTNFQVSNAGFPFPPVRINIEDKYANQKKPLDLNTISELTHITNDAIEANLKSKNFKANEKHWYEDVIIDLNVYFGQRLLNIKAPKGIRIQSPTYYTFHGPSILSRGESHKGIVKFFNMSKKGKDIEYEIIHPSHIKHLPEGLDPLVQTPESQRKSENINASKESFERKEFINKNVIKALDKETEFEIPLYVCKDAALYSTYKLHIKLYRNGFLIQDYEHLIVISPLYVPVELNNNPFDILLVLSKNTAEKAFLQIQTVIDELGLSVNYMDFKKNSEPFFKGENWAGAWKNKTIIFFIADEKEFTSHYFGNHLISNFIDGNTKFDTSLLLIKPTPFDHKGINQSLFSKEYDIFDYPELTGTFIVSDISEGHMLENMAKKISELEVLHDSKFIHHISHKYQPEKIGALGKYLYGEGKYGILKLDKIDRMNVHMITPDSPLKRDVIESLPIAKKLDLVLKGIVKPEEVEIYLYIDLWPEFLYKNCKFSKIYHLKSALEARKDFLESKDVMSCVWTNLVEIEANVKGLFSNSKTTKENLAKFQQIKKEIKQLFFGDFEKVEGIKSLFKKVKIDTQKDQLSNDIMTLSKKASKSRDFEKLSSSNDTTNFIPIGQLNIKIPKEGFFEKLLGD